ncbi:MAG: tetratricopeptide repeat protein, partial [Myxococcales bacterium]|nr:tetratricopeptide repeat protein [Myxococcales bacterium]
MRTAQSLRGLALIIGCSLGTQACGPKPPPPPPPPDPIKIQQEQGPKGLTPEAEAAFNEGVQALQATPPEYPKAAEAFEKAVKIWPEYQVALLNQAYSYEKLGRYADAAGTYRQLIKLKVQDAGVTLALGRSLLLSGEPDQAITEFESVLRQNPDDLKARNNLAAGYLDKGDYATSLRYVKEVLAVQPKNVPATINLGLLYLKEKKLPLALLMFNKAIGYEENNARAHNNLGLTFYAMNVVPLAVNSFEKAIALDPTMDEARLNLASIYLDYLDYAAALPQFQAVRQRFPKHYQA